jgi:hypothetical protein
MRAREEEDRAVHRSDPGSRCGLLGLQSPQMFAVPGKVDGLKSVQFHPFMAAQESLHNM